MGGNQLIHLRVLESKAKWEGLRELDRKKMSWVDANSRARRNARRQTRSARLENRELGTRAKKAGARGVKAMGGLQPPPLCLPQANEAKLTIWSCVRVVVRERKRVVREREICVLGVLGARGREG